MSTTVQDRPAPAPAPEPRPAGPANGGGPARRAVIRWAWRLFRREWRQQLLVLSLITVALAATVLGGAVAVNTPPPASTGFGTAQNTAMFAGNDPHLAARIAAIRHRFGTAEVIEDQDLQVPGSVTTFQLRAQSPAGPFGQPMLSLVSGHYPTGPGQVALTSGVARELGLATGSVWRQGGSGSGTGAGTGTARRVTGIVQNPQDLLDEFALVAPGQVARPTQVIVLFNAHGVAPEQIGPTVRSQATASSQNAINPETILLALATVGMLLIALVGVGGFTVLAQRRLRALGLLGSLGATDKNIRLVIRANGIVTGLAGALLGTVIGIAAWLAYRPRVQVSAHHVIAPFALPWTVIGPAIGLAVLATWFAASRPAKAMARVPVVTALSGRPAPPKRVRRSAIPGLICIAVAFVVLGMSGASGGNGNGMLEVVLGFAALIAGIILLAPTCLALLARLAPRTPVAVRVALRDLSRYRARSGSALAAISVSVLIAVVVTVSAAGRFGNVLDYAGPNLDPDQIVIHTPDWYPGPAGPGSSGPATVGSAQAAAQATAARRIAAAVGARSMLELDGTSATLQHAAAGRGFSGPVYVATPALLRAFGISASQVSPSADVLTMRPGFAGISRMQLIYGSYFEQSGPNGPGENSFPCPRTSCQAGPVMQTVDALPSGTSAPNTVITEHAVHALGLTPFVSGWLVRAAHPPTAAQISNARAAAAAAGLTIETRSSIPSVTAITGWATAAGILLALCILAMSIGLIRSETAGDLRILTATGAAGPTRRMITAATAGTLGLAGGLLGTAAGYLGAIAWFRDSPNDGLSALASVPVWNLVIIVAGLPLAAAAAGWLLAGREPAAIARRPIE
ncbi:MAG TPA: FtsX-like permease family protein [Streptosporangiaceae bacterium]|jgi:putative ABC transport system permease protein|nr:FtsX-like permease family protein [Streptosporangiaceae bacterium]